MNGLSLERRPIVLENGSYRPAADGHFGIRFASIRITGQRQSPLDMGRSTYSVEVMAPGLGVAAEENRWVLIAPMGQGRKKGRPYGHSD